VFTLTATLYVVLALILDLHYEVFPPDSVFRMANGFYVLYSRHPHIAAIGFVWNPLMSMADMVPLLFKDLWHPLVSRDVAASLVTVGCMAGATYQMYALLKDWQVGRPIRFLLTALFALNPMILYYATNGMSEALYLVTMVGTVRYLSRWSARDDTRSLVYAGSMLALCYLAREEAILAAALSGVLVFVVGARRVSNPGTRFVSGMTDSTIYLAPFLVSFFGWALASKVITGSFFEQFTSQYGNSAQIKLYGSYYHLQPGHYAARLAHEVRDLEAIAPLLPLVLVAAATVALRRRDVRILAPLAVLGGGISFTLVGFLGNMVFPWFRFYILAVPLSVILVGFLLAPRHAPVTSAPPRALSPPRIGHEWRARPMVKAGVATIVTLILVGPSLATTAAAMDNPNIGIEESGQLVAVFHPDRFRATPGDNALLPVMHYLDRLHLPDGDVVTDDAYDCMATVIMRSTNPRIFVITNDADFQRILADPLVWHAHYLVVPPPGGVYNAITAAYPDIYASGSGFSELVHQFPATSICPPLRLYKVVRDTTAA